MGQNNIKVTRRKKRDTKIQSSVTTRSAGSSTRVRRRITSGGPSGAQKAALTSGSGPLSRKAASAKAESDANLPIQNRNLLSSPQSGSQRKGTDTLPSEGAASSPSTLDNIGGVLKSINEFGGEKRNDAGQIVDAAGNPITGGAPLSFFGMGSPSSVAGLSHFIKGFKKTPNIIGKIVVPATKASDLVAKNTKTTSTTIKWLTGLGIAAGVSLGVSSLAKDIYGTYPFAGFLKEEGLQTLGFGYKAAMSIDDLDGAQAALDLQNEFLDPNYQNGISDNIPYKNVLLAVDDFKEAAALTNALQQKVLDDRRFQLEHGETDDQKFARIAQEREDNKLLVQKEQEVYYANLARLQREAEVDQRNEDAAFWARQSEKRLQEEADAREAEADFWTAYYKEIAKVRTDASPSNLKFGLL